MQPEPGAEVYLPVEVRVSAGHTRQHGTACLRVAVFEGDAVEGTAFIVAQCLQRLPGNPIVGYSKLKNCIRLLFWSGQSFDEDGLNKEGSFKAAEARYTAVDQVDTKKLKRWLDEARDVQWDYKNLIRRKGRLERLK